MLAVAAFEAYVSAVLEELARRVETDAAVLDFSRLPERMQVFSVFESLEFAMRGPRYAPPRPQFDRLPDVRAAASGALAQVVNAGVFGNSEGNPGSKSLADMIRRLGIQDLYRSVKPHFDRGWPTPTVDRFIPDKLDEVVGRRNVVAHTANVMSFSRRDLKEGIRFLRALAIALDSLLRVEVNRIRRQARR